MSVYATIWDVGFPNDDMVDIARSTIDPDHLTLRATDNIYHELDTDQVRDLIRALEGWVTRER